MELIIKQARTLHEQGAIRDVEDKKRLQEAETEIAR